MKNYETSDIALAAFLLMMGITLITAKKTTSGKFQFEFHDPDTRIPVLAIEFVNSDFVKFDNAVRSLRNLIYK